MVSTRFEIEIDTKRKAAAAVAGLVEKKTKEEGAEPANDSG
jgi:hypothetical protein